MSPAARAVGIAAFVTSAAVGLYSIAAVLDRWPELVIAAWGASLGAGMAINGIALREMDAHGATTAGERRRDLTAAVQHQLCTFVVAVAAWQIAATESFGWAAAAVIAGVAWAWTFPRLVGAMERATSTDAMRAYLRAFQLVVIVFVATLIYASIALDTVWLWRPKVPADVQAVLWLLVLEFSGLPLTLVALTR